MPTVEKWIEVNAPVKLVFDLFSDFKSMPRWMHSVSDVQRLSYNRTRWMLAGTSSNTVAQWETETTAFEPAQRVAWRGVGGDVDAGGDVTFENTKRGTTLLRVQLGYDPVSEHPGAFAIARLLSKNLARHLEEDIQRFKSMAEEAHQTVQQSVVVAPPATTMLASKQAAPARSNEEVQHRNLKANRLVTSEDATPEAIFQEPRDDGVMERPQVVDTKVDRPVSQHVGVYRDEPPEELPLQARDVEQSHTVNTDGIISGNAAGRCADDRHRRPAPCRIRTHETFNTALC